MKHIPKTVAFLSAGGLPTQLIHLGAAPILTLLHSRETIGRLTSSLALAGVGWQRCFAFLCGSYIVATIRCDAFANIECAKFHPLRALPPL